MSDEQRKDEETEVEAHHHRRSANDEVREDDEVEAHHHRYRANDEASDEDDEVEGHVMGKYS